MGIAVEVDDFNVRARRTGLVEFGVGQDAAGVNVHAWRRRYGLTLKPVTSISRNDALKILCQALGPTADFRDGQWDAIDAIVNESSRVLVVQRTGWGKSAVYFVATRLLRDKHAGVTVIVSPLLALMRDQIEAASRFGLNAVTINTENKQEWDEVERLLVDDLADVLLISPERFNNPEFRERLLARLTKSAGLLVIDEAHCISDWGHDFRPDYRRLKNILQYMPAGRPVLCTTATANKRVVRDIRDQLGEKLRLVRGALDRESLALHALEIPSTVNRLAWLSRAIPKIEGSGIVYCLTVADSERVANWLSLNGIAAEAYSGETDGDRRIEIEKKLKANELKVVASTSALGMGFDKPDLSFVIHFQSPDSPVAYYQQVGRAGRAVERADAILLWGRKDEEIWDFFLRTSLPVQEQAEDVVAFLKDAGSWVKLSDLESNFNMPRGRILALLKILDVDGVVEKASRGWQFRWTMKTDWAFDNWRIQRVKEARLGEHEAMRNYATTAGCRMMFLRKCLHDRTPQSCGRCDNCAGHRFDPATDDTTVRKARTFIRSRPIMIEPRLRWAGTRSGRIANSLEPGRALCYLGDPEWGDAVFEAKSKGTPLPEDMVEAASTLVQSWLPGFKGTICYVPNTDPKRTIVSDFATRLARMTGLPLSHCLIKKFPNPPQKMMENSATQLDNVADVFDTSEPVPRGEILLVDDISDSRWTMTVLGDLLKRRGCGRVYPFAVAKTKG